MMDQANIDFERLRRLIEAARVRRDRHARLNRTCDLRRSQFREVNGRLEAARAGFRSYRDVEERLAPFKAELEQAERLLDVALEDRATAAAERPEVDRIAMSCAEFVYDLLGERTPIDVQEFLGVA